MWIVHRNGHQEVSFDHGHNICEIVTKTVRNVRRKIHSRHDIHPD